MKEARLENWRFVELQVVGKERRLMGDVYGHPSFDDGASVVVSRIEEERIGQVQTKNTLYTLGTPMDNPEEDNQLYEDLLKLCGHIGLAQDEVHARAISANMRCDECYGTGNGMYSMYQKCKECEGSGLKREIH